MYHYVMQVIKGTVIAHGPYKSSEAAQNRYDKVRGGEVHMFKSYSPDPQDAIQEFNVENL